MTNNSSSVTNGEDVPISVTRPERTEGDRPSKAIDPSEKHLGTDHLLGDLKGRTISGAFITIASQGTQFLLNLASIMVLARLLAPKDFGLYAMVTTVMGFLRIFQDAGLSTATVQRQEITHAQVSNLFWVNVGLGGVTTLLVAALAPVVAWFYREPRLVGITLVLSSTFLLASSAVQHIALLNRQMRFGAIAMIDIVSMLAGYLTGIGMALSGYGYWALVGAAVAQVAIKLVLAWLISGWRPQLPSRNTQTWHLLTFRREHYRREPDILARPGCGQPFDWAVFWCRGSRSVFQGLHPSHPAAGTIHRTNQCRADSGAIAGPD